VITRRRVQRGGRRTNTKVVQQLTEPPK
jgi:hypothetical protein